jgi:transposase
MVYAVDASTIDLCLSMFPWAHFRKTKAAIKLHTQIDLTGSIPVFMHITEGSVHDVNFIEQMLFELGCIYVFDRGYLDFARLFGVEKAKAYFVIRAKSNTKFKILASRPVDKSSGLRCDQTIRLSTYKGKRDYPEKLRRISFFDTDTRKRLVFLTNHFDLPAQVIAAIYKRRWQIELFFKWIKQNLRIKAFFGTTENAVQTQIWIAICVYLMVACLNKVHGIEESLSRILQILSVNVFQKVALNQLLGDFTINKDKREISNQLIFKDF